MSCEHCIHYQPCGLTAAQVGECCPYYADERLLMVDSAEKSKTQEAYFRFTRSNGAEEYVKCGYSMLSIPLEKMAALFAAEKAEHITKAEYIAGGGGELDSIPVAALRQELEGISFAKQTDMANTADYRLECAIERVLEWVETPAGRERIARVLK